MNSESTKLNNFMNLNAFRSGRRDRVSIDISNPEDDPTIKEDYQIAICQNGKFAVTFDTGKILNLLCDFNIFCIYINK